MKDTPTKIGAGRSWSPKDKPEQITWYFAIEWKNNPQGQFSTKKEAQTKFTVGTEVEFTVEERNNKPFYNIPREPFSGESRFNLEWEREKQREIQKSVALKATIELCCAGKCEINDLSTVYAGLKALLTGNEWTGKDTEEKAEASQERLDENREEQYKEAQDFLRTMTNEFPLALATIQGKCKHKPIEDMNAFQLRYFNKACEKVYQEVKNK